MWNECEYMFFLVVFALTALQPVSQLFPFQFSQKLQRNLQESSSLDAPLLLLFLPVQIIFPFLLFIISTILSENLLKDFQLVLHKQGNVLFKSLQQSIREATKCLSENIIYFVFEWFISHCCDINKPWMLTLDLPDAPGPLWKHDK